MAIIIASILDQYIAIRTGSWVSRWHDDWISSQVYVQVENEIYVSYPPIYTIL